MKSSHAIAISLLGLGLLLSSTASAQKIRSYQKEAESNYNAGAAPTSQVNPNYGYVPPGAPAPTNAAAKSTDGKDTEKKDGEESAYSEQVNLYKGSSVGARRTTLTLKPEELYHGVIPGTRDEVSHLNRERKRGESSTNRILWVGFQAREQSTRVFIQTAREAQYDVSTFDGGVLLTVSDAKFSARNFSRFVDTSFFGRNVQRIEAKKTGRKTIEIKVFLNKAERPQVNSTSNYVYLEFSAEGSAATKESETSGSDSNAPRALDE